MKYTNALTLLSLALMVSACGGERDTAEIHGPDPKLPEAQRGLFPSMKIAEPVSWGEQKPTVPQGYSITAIAHDLKIPRQTLVLPNGDIIVSEGRGGTEAKLKPKDVIAGYIKAKGNTQVKGGNRLTLLRDADGDGVYEMQTVFAENLNAPYGLAFANGKLYVANQDALVSFDYVTGQTKATGAPTKLADLPAEVNHHWTKSLAVSADGRFLYVGIGSNSNITERGMEVEIDRAQIWQIDAQTGLHKPYATGVRNPTALKFNPLPASSGPSPTNATR
jgi:glucose/arabinose dehydrogenase